MSPFEKSTLNIHLRVRVAYAVVACAFFLLVLRLWYLQIVKGEFFRQLSENNRIRTVFVPPPRGRIFDRNGEVLAKNRPSFNVELVTEDCPDVPATLTRLEQIVKFAAGTLQREEKYQLKRRAFEPRLIMRDVSRDVVARIAARRHELPGITIGVVPARDYTHGALAAHGIGYIREISKEQIGKPPYQKARQGDLVGQYGLERMLETQLQGVRGLQRLEVDAHGVRIGEFSFEPERIGHDIHLTIDLDVQRIADEALRDLSGAIVALDPANGEVIALSSSPGFDPNIFTAEMSEEVWRDLSLGKEKKLNNRVLQGTFPPGSTFKMIMAVAALAEGVITPHTKVSCPGHLYFGGRDFRCHKRGGHGVVDLRNAIIQSCDVYFYEVGQRLGIDRIHDYATRFGLGVASGIGVVQESVGIIPSTEWKKNYYSRAEDKKWYPGETLSVAIGQGALTVNPMQMARATAALVNGGKVFRSRLVSKVVSSEGGLIERTQAEQVGTLEVDSKTLRFVQDAMLGVVSDPRGTGHRARLEAFPEINVGGKTGTAQVGSRAVEGKGKQFEDHAWFIAFAPAEKPEIALAVVVENGGHGGVAAAPLAKTVLQAYFWKREELRRKEAKQSKQPVTEARELTLEQRRG